MKVARLHGVGDIRLHEESEPVAQEGEGLVRIESVGICGSDLHWFNEGSIGDSTLDRPLVLGHEFAGVALDGPNEGRRVAVDPAVPCNQCRYCLEGNPNLCLSVRFAGHGIEDGALQERIAWPVDCQFPLPETVSAAEGVMLEPLGVALHALDLGKVRPAMQVGVFGCGPIGLMLLQLLRLSGATCRVATEILPHRREAARENGATVVIDATADDTDAQVREAVEGDGLDVAFEVAGENPAVEAAIAAARPGARVVLVGIPEDDRTSFCASVARRKGLTIKMTRRMKHVYPRAIHLLERGLVDLESLVTDRFPVDRVSEAFQHASERKGLKVVVEL